MMLYLKFGLYRILVYSGFGFLSFVNLLSLWIYGETCLNQTLNKPESCINLSKPNPE
jgi:hypothetical protein